MKNSLDFNLQYSYLEGQNFIQCFASAYMFLEATTDPAAIFYDPDVGGHCFGCGSGGELHHCKKDKTAAKRCAFFFLFNTMCGNSSIRRRFNGTPTEMQKMIGGDDQGCGSDFTVDFLFGYAGYEYRKCTDAASFKAEIIAAIDAGRPVIAKTKQKCPDFHKTVEIPVFHVITGYDGDALTVPHTIYYDNPWANPTLKPERIPGYDDLEVLYIFGKKTTRRHTLKDGLNNIRRVMEYNIKEGLWDEYLTKLGGCDKFPSDDGLDKAGPDERQARAKHLAETNLYMYNFCSFGGALNCDSKLPNHDLHKELFSPALSEVWSGINETHWAIVDAGHKTGKLNWEQIWLIDDPAKISALSTEICEAIVTARTADIEVLEIIKQAINVLNNT